MNAQNLTTNELPIGQIEGGATMTSYKHILYAAIASASLSMPGAYAQDLLEEEVEELPPLYVSEVEIGVGYNSDDSYKFGKFNGLDEEGAFFIGNFDVRKNRTAGDSSADYWELAGQNLGLDGRSVFAQYSRAGVFSVYVDYDERMNNLIDDGLTPYSGAGTERLTLPSTWIPANSVDALTNNGSLFPNLRSVTMEKDRQKVGGGITYDISDIWQAVGNYHHEDKDGTDDFGAIFGSSGGNPRGAVVPIPHEFTFDEFDVGVVYKGEKAQFTLTYNLSLFENQITSLVFDNAFANTQWPAAARSATGALIQGQIGNLFPDNEAWSVNFSGGYNFAPATRLTLNATYGEMTQDEAFLPYSIISALYNVPGLEALPRDNLDGEIANTYVNLNLTHRYNSEIDVKARFTYDDRDNSTPRDVYARIAGDSQLQSTGTHRYNRPYSLERMKFEAEGGYRLPRMSRLTAGYTYETKDRDYQEVETTEEHAFQVKLNSMPAEWIGGWARYRYSTLDGDNDIPDFYQEVMDAALAAGLNVDPNVRDIGNYFGNRPFLEGEDPEEIETMVAAFLAAPTAAGFNAFFENDPLMRKYYMANRDQHQFNLNVNLYPTQEWTMTALGKYTHNDFEDSPLGMQNSTLESLTFDVVYAPSDRFSANAFFTVEKNDYYQRAWRHAGGQYLFLSEAARSAGKVSPLTGANGYRYYTEDSIYTTGMNFAWEVIEDKFNLDLDMTYSDATTDIEPRAENYAASSGLGSVAPIPFPDVETRIYRLMLTGDYKLKDNWGTRVYYWYERFNSTDFELDDVGVNALDLIGVVTGSTSGGSVILLGNQAPTYNNHVIGFTIYRKF
ncbi:MAG: MtrB/PioB family decaheme-associated outer membrane protein [Gammaproteobacteria bacterium]|nr:MAG: MtrB/PioB family decaheme-associated outer membrane protein [Gammaproteobacteria bacterium]